MVGLCCSNWPSWPQWEEWNTNYSLRFCSLTCFASCILKTLLTRFYDFVGCAFDCGNSTCSAICVAAKNSFTCCVNVGFDRCNVIWITFILQTICCTSMWSNGLNLISNFHFLFRLPLFTVCRRFLIWFFHKCQILNIFELPYQIALLRAVLQPFQVLLIRD